MKFHPRIWIPIAQLLTVINVAAVYFAARATQPWEAVVHAALAVAFTVWADWLRARATGY